MTTDLVAQARGDLHEIAAVSPEQMIAVATKIATSLASIVERQRLYTKVGQGKHVNVEGWTTMGAMLGIVPRERDVQHTDGEFIAYVELVSLKTGAIVGGGSATCGASDPTWAKRPLNAQRSMAITRATGKAYRLGYSWIMKLAGYEAAPAEEMDHVRSDDSHHPPHRPQSSGFDPNQATHVVWLKHALEKEGLLDSFEAIKEELTGMPREAVGAIIGRLRSVAL